MKTMTQIYSIERNSLIVHCRQRRRERRFLYILGLSTLVFLLSLFLTSCGSKNPDRIRLENYMMRDYEAYGEGKPINTGDVEITVEFREVVKHDKQLQK